MVNNNNYKVVGAKAGDKPRQPNIAKDSVSSISTAKILYGLNDGEISGIVGGGKGIKLEDTPLLDEAGKENFKGVKWDFRAGTLDQEYIEGFPDISNETGVGVELKGGVDWIKAISNPVLSAVRIRLSWNGLRKQNIENGDVSGYKIDYAVDVKTGSGAYIEVLKTNINDKVTGKYERTHRIALPKSSSGWQIRVRRLTPNANLDNVQDKMFIESITEVIDQKFTYPHTSLLGIQYDAKTFSRIAKLAIRCKGKLIKIPSNYNSDANTYTGVWNGQFKLEYSNNPAWIFYDLVTSKRYGLGKRIDPSMVDKWSLYDLGAYCDALVPDGQGSTEKRYTCNVYLQSQAEAYQILSQLSGIFRAITYWSGQQLVLSADVPKDPTYTFSRANVIDGQFEYTGTRARDRHTVAKVAFDNPKENFKTEYEYIRDEAGIAKFGINVIDISAIGCTSRGQAQRAGLWALKSEQLETRTVTFRTGLEGFNLLVGEVIEVSDELLAGRANGGRITAVDSTLKGVTVDREAVIKVNDFITVNAKDGVSQRRKVVAVSGKVITVLTPFVEVEAGAVWAISSVDLNTMQFRVMSIKPDEDNIFAITAIQHEPLKYAAVDHGADVKPTSISIIKPTNVAPPASVGLSANYRVVQGQSVATLVIQWSQVKDAVGYSVEWRRNDGNWIKLPLTGNVSAEVEGVYEGNYQARVKSVNAFDVESDFTNSILTNIKGKVGSPKALASITATGILFGMDIKWNFLAGSEDTNYTEIQTATDASGANTALLGSFSYPTDKTTVNGLQGGLTVFYRGRIVDKLGNAGNWSAWVSGTTDNSAGKVLQILTGQITESQLYEDLNTKIDKIGTNSTAIGGINTGLDKAKADIIEANNVIAANKLEAANAVAAANTEIAASKVIINSNKAEITASRTELNTAKTQLATAITDINTANTKIADSKLLIDANKAKLVLTDAEVAAAKTKVTALETDYNDNKTSVSNALTVLTNKDKSIAADLTALTANYGTSEAKLVQDLKVLTDKDVALTNSVTTLSSSYEANKTKVATDITTLVNKDTALNNLITTLDSDYKTNKASVSNSLTTLTNKDTSLASDISNLNTKTDNTNAEIVTVKNIVSDNTSSIANTKTELTAAFKAIDDIEIGGRNLLTTSIFPSTLVLAKSVWATDGTFSVGQPDAFGGSNAVLIKPKSNNSYLYQSKSVYPIAGEYTLSFWAKGNKAGLINVSMVKQGKEQYLEVTDAWKFYSITKTVTKIDNFYQVVFMGWNSWLDLSLEVSLSHIKLEKGNKATAWTQAPEEIEEAIAVNTASISTEAVARADADKAITSSVTTLKSDYDANKASVTQSLGTLTTKDTALTNQLTALTSTVGTNTANITTNNNALVAKDKAIADSVTALDAKYEGNKTSVSSQLTALVDKDTATANQLTALDTDYKGNKTAIRNELTAVSNKTDSTANSLTSLTTEVGKNKTAITTEATTRSTEDTALSNRITTVSGKTDNALSRITTAETTIANNTGAITQQKTDITAAYKKAIDDIEVGGRNLVLDTAIMRTEIGTASANITNSDGILTLVSNGSELWKGSPLIEVKAGVSYTVSIRAKAENLDIGLSMPLFYDGFWHSPYKTYAKDTSGKWITISETFVPVTDSLMRIAIHNHNNTTGIAYYKQVKIEKGNKATDWTPAPEDVEASITAAITTESTARTSAVEAVANTVTALDSRFEGNKATVANSLTTLTNKDTSLANSITALTTTVGNNTTAISTEATARSTADTAIGNRITTVEGKTDNALSRVSTVETIAATNKSSLAQQKTEVEAKFNNLANKNLIDNGTFTVGQSRNPWSIAASTIVVGETSYDGTLNAIRLGVNNSNSYILASGLFKELGFHTLSFWIKGNKSGSLNVSLGAQGVTNYIPINTVWTKHTISTNVTSLTGYSVVFGGWSSWTDLSLEVSLSNIELTKDSASINDVAASVTAEALARTSADSALSNRITALDSDYQGNKSAIRNELTTVSNKANTTANSLNTLTSTVANNTGAISTEATTRANEDGALSNRINTVKATADNAQARVGTVETAVATNTGAIAQTSTKISAAIAAIEVGGRNFLANSADVTLNYSDYGNNGLTIHHEQGYKSIRANANGNVYGYLATTSQIDEGLYTFSMEVNTTFNTSMYFRIGGVGDYAIQIPNTGGTWRKISHTYTGSYRGINESFLLGFTNLVANTPIYFRGLKVEKGNTASDWTPAPEDIKNDVAAIEVKATATANKVTGLEAQYTVKLDVGGRVSGFGLASSTTYSDFAVNADRFYIAPPTGSSKGTSPFMVLSTPTNINGTVVPSGTYIQSAFIHDGSIDVAKINKASITNLSAISANIGHFKSAPSGARLEIQDSLLSVYDANNRLRVRLGLW